MKGYCSLKKLIALLTAACCFLFPHLTAYRVVSIGTLPTHKLALCGGDRIHFLKTGNSDAIVLESDGHFAMVDAGEDTDNPRSFPGLELPGYEQEVLGYLKQNCADENGKVHLDFVLGTHAHSDHIGGFDTILLDPDVTVGRAYLKAYDSSRINDHEVTDWDNQEVYDQMVAALRARNIPQIQNPDPVTFAFGHFTVTLINAVDPAADGKVGENDNSFGVLLEKNGTKIFLAGDMDNLSGDEARLAPEIGKVDLLKVGHHGYAGSSSETFIATLKPETCVVTNNRFGPSHDTLMSIIKILRHDRIYLTGCENGVLAVVGDQGQINYFGGICCWKTK